MVASIRHRLGLFFFWAVVPSVAFLSVLALAAGRAEAICSTTWIGGVDSNFGTAGNWSASTPVRDP